MPKKLKLKRIGWATKYRKTMLGNRLGTMYSTKKAAVSHASYLLHTIKDVVPVYIGEPIKPTWRPDPTKLLRMLNASQKNTKK